MASRTSVEQTIHYLHEGDREPPLQATLLLDGEPFDLTGARRVEFEMKTRGGETVIDSRASIEDSEHGKVQYEWSRGETDQAGKFRGRFVVDGTTSFPNTGYIDIFIHG